MVLLSFLGLTALVYVVIGILVFNGWIQAFVHHYFQTGEKVSNEELKLAGYCALVWPLFLRLAIRYLRRP